MKNIPGESVDNSPIFKTETMPTDKKKAAKKSARTKRSGARLLKASVRQTEKGKKNFSASGGRKYAKKVTANQTASNYETEGKKRLETGKKTAKKKDLKVTPRSEKRAKAAENKRMNTRNRKKR